MITLEIAVALVCALGIAAAGLWTLYRGATTTAPYLEVAAALFAFAVLGSLLCTQMLVFVLALPAQAVTLLDLSAAWDQSVLVRWAALMKRYGEMKQIGVSLHEIQAALLLGIVAFAGMRLIHHAVVVLRVLKVARRNQMQMLRKEA